MHGLVVLSGVPESSSQVRVDRQVEGVELQRAPSRGKILWLAVHVFQERAVPQIGGRVARVESNRLTEELLGVRPAPFVKRGAGAERREAIGELWIELKRSEGGRLHRGRHGIWR